MFCGGFCLFFVFWHYFVFLKIFGILWFCQKRRKILQFLKIFPLFKRFGGWSGAGH
jgi:hypothetical protein